MSFSYSSLLIYRDALEQTVYESLLDAVPGLDEHLHTATPADIRSIADLVRVFT
jgi:hypothetical protein